MQYKKFAARYLSIPGFSWPESFAIWDFFLSEQSQAGVAGNLLEIGVYYGQSALLLAYHAKVSEHLVLVDPTDFVETARKNVEAAKAENVRIIKARSDDGSVRNLSQAYGRTFRWVHIDGDHRAEAVLNDLGIADKLLKAKGIICIDDFFSPRYPGITYAVLQYLQAHPEELTLVLCGFNKGYLVRPSAARACLEAIRHRLGAWLQALGFNNFTIFKTDVPGILNCFGIQQRWKDYVHYGLDEDPSQIVY
ncbi:MAG TPA: class I SAM-dependent methyltransferase [Chthoniobacterales bacterium]